MSRRTIPIHDERQAPVEGLSRRDFMGFTAASLALAGLGACSRAPQETIVPAVRNQAGNDPGIPSFFATAHVHRGYANGILIESHEGRPTKVEGNAKHPASLGATDAFAQASILELWDPGRSRSPLRAGQIESWDAFFRGFGDRLRAVEASRGEGFHLLTGTVTSPTLLAQIHAMSGRYPGMLWHANDAWSRGNAVEGSRIAFGRPVDVRHDLTHADVIVALDADFLFEPAGRIRHAHDFATRRAPDRMNRLYVFEPATTITGSRADHRFAVPASTIESIAVQLARRLGLQVPDVQAASSIDATALDAIARDLTSRQGVVLVGDRQPVQVHVLVHAINERIGAFGRVCTPIEAVAGSDGAQTLKSLADALNADSVELLVMVDVDPAFDAPADLDFAAAIGKARCSVHHGLYANETARRSTWHIPLAHPYESWSDARAFDGTATILQPLIAPLYAGRSAHQLFGHVLGDTRNDHENVRNHWQAQIERGRSFDAFWRTTLHDGLIADSAYPAVAARPVVELGKLRFASNPAEGIELAFAPDPSAWDGRYAGNAWLQELPRPVSKLTWDNAMLVGGTLARKRRWSNGDVVEIVVGVRRLEVPVWIDAGHAADAVTLHIGNGGRTALADAPIGFDAQRLRTEAAASFVVATLNSTQSKHLFASTQEHHAMEGRDLARSVRHDEIPATVPPSSPQPSLYPPVAYDGYKWGMSIDLNTCIGCNACTIACQAENNIPVVGKEEVARGRAMHWIRIDHYVEAEDSQATTQVQPVPCMQCENAPCEVVCPVEASIHDDEGINVQVYNRCIGTRFCSNNCPYKVRRFNWFDYGSSEPALMAQKNPEVTVRGRGVMEKCNYCLQRIAGAHVVAGREDRRIHDGEVVSACMAVCPTKAIVFGDLNDPTSAVSVAKRDPRAYVLLEELDTRPRTTYRSRVRNPNPEIDRG